MQRCKHDICVRKAKIASIGERVQDYFLITDNQGHAINNEHQKALVDDICSQLDKHILSEQ